MLIVILRRYDESAVADKTRATRNKVRARLFTPPGFVQKDILLGTLKYTSSQAIIEPKVITSKDTTIYGRQLTKGSSIY